MPVAGEIHNLGPRRRRKRSRRRFLGRGKHGGEEDGSLLYAPPRKGALVGFALEKQQEVRATTGNIQNELHTTSVSQILKFTCCTDSSDHSAAGSEPDREKAEKRQGARSGEVHSG